MTPRAENVALADAVRARRVSAHYAASAIPSDDAERIASALAATFPGPPGRYLRQAASGAEGWARGELTPAVFRRHVEGRERIGRPFDPERLSWAAFDLDGKRHPSGRAWALATAQRIAGALADLGLPSLLEQSRSGAGFHVWILFAANGPALDAARELAAGVLRVLELPSDFSEKVGVPGFYPWPPKAKECGRVPYLPLFAACNGKPSGLLCDLRTGEPFADQLAALEAAERTPRDVFDAALETVRRVAPAPPVTSKPEPPRVAPRTFSGELTPYAEAALRREVERVTSASDGAKHPTLYSASRNLGELIGGDELPRPLVESSLTDATAGWPLERAAEVAATIRDGIEKGLANPRHGNPPAMRKSAAPATADELEAPGVEASEPWPDADHGAKVTWTPSTLAGVEDETAGETDYLIDAMIPRGEVTMLGAAWKSGKTLFAYRLVVDYIAGRLVFGRFKVTAPGNVALFQLEMPSREDDRRFRRVAIGCGLYPREIVEYAKAGRLVVYNRPDGFTLTTGEGIRRFHEAVRAADASLIVVDSVVAAFAGLDLNDNSAVRRAFSGAFLPLTSEGRTLILLHHKRKAPSGGKANHDDDRSALLGAQAWGAAAGRVYALERLADDGTKGGTAFRIRLSLTGSWTPSDALDVVLDVRDTPDGGTVVVALDEGAQIRGGGINGTQRAALALAALVRDRRLVDRKEALALVAADLNVADRTAAEGLKYGKARGWVETTLSTKGRGALDLVPGENAGDL